MALGRPRAEIPYSCLQGRPRGWLAFADLGPKTYKPCKARLSPVSLGSNTIPRNPQEGSRPAGRRKMSDGLAPRAPSTSGIS